MSTNRIRCPVVASSLAWSGMASSSSALEPGYAPLIASHRSRLNLRTNDAGATLPDA
jgi:hypothetical protein